MNYFSTRQAAKKLGMDLRTISRYIAAKKIPAPPLTRVGGVRVRLWSDEAIEKVREILPQIENGRKTRYQKQKKRTKKSKP